LDDVTVWPPEGADPRTDAARSAYFDSLTYCAAVVGLNTSALVEAAIVGKASYTVVLPETQGTQEGTLHFQHLLRENGGPLLVARTMDEHFAHLAAALESPEEGREAVDAFVSSFVRPAGRDRACAPILVDDLELAVASRGAVAQVAAARPPSAAIRVLAHVPRSRPRRKQRHRRPPPHKRPTRTWRSVLIMLARMTPEPLKEGLRRHRASRGVP
jgi:hypothetical protein